MMSKEEERISKVRMVNKDNCVNTFMIEYRALEGFPGGSVVKNRPANTGELGLIPGSGRSPAEGNGNPLQYSCQENSMYRGAWQS